MPAPASSLSATGGRAIPSPATSLSPNSAKQQRAPSSTPERAYNPPPPKPKRMEMKTTLGQLINQEVLSDHFDHYGAPSLSRPSKQLPSSRYDSNHNHQPARPTSLSASYPSYGDSTSYNSRHPPASNNMSDSLTDDEFVEAETDFSVTESKPQLRNHNNNRNAGAAVRRNPSSLSRDDTYITSIENDVRKRISFVYEPTRTQDDYALTAKAKKQQASQNKLATAMSKQMGSLPDITSLSDLAGMKKEDLMKLSAARREEIRKLLEEQERRNAGDLSVLAGDLKVCLCYRKCVLCRHPK